MNSNTAQGLVEDRAYFSVWDGAFSASISLYPINIDNEEHVEQLRSFVREFSEDDHDQFLERLLSAQELGDHPIYVTELIRSADRTLAVLSLEFFEGDVTVRFIPTRVWKNSERKAALAALGAHIEDLAVKQDWKRLLVKEPSKSGLIALREILGRELPNGTIVEECS